MLERVFVKGSVLTTLVFSVGFGQQLWAMTDYDAQSVMFDFALAATCSDVGSPEDFHAVNVVEPQDEEIMGSYGAYYAVAWFGDLYCSGGRTATWQISYVGGGVGNSLFVDLSSPPLHLDFIGVDSIDLDENNDLRITGVAYGPNSQSHWDTTPKRATVSRGGELLSSEMLIGGSWIEESNIN